MKYYEANFDGLVGPTHNYAGLSYGNMASLSHATTKSNPKAAAKQGLAKAKALADMGVIQGVLAPQERPDLYTLRRIGFIGTDTQILNKAAKQAPELLKACCSASSMWAANAATISPSTDTYDGKIHFTPANLVDKLHRCIEPVTTGNILAATFNHPDYFHHHQHLLEHPILGDEGAANHTRLCYEYGNKGIEVFVYGHQATNPTAKKPKIFPARQSLEASQAIARLHQLDDNNCIFIQQNPDVIDQGVFHNDVIAVGNQNLLFYHQQAFVDTQNKQNEIRRKFNAFNDSKPLYFIDVPTHKVSIEDAVKSYLFNIQIITLPHGEMAIIAPTDCRENATIYNYLSELLTFDTPIKQIHYFDLKQSMQNGGGPACLRLRVAMSEAEVAAVNQNTLLDESLFNRLTIWIDKHYRDALDIKDLADPLLLIESRTALDELTQIMKLGSIYQFQK